MVVDVEEGSRVRRIGIIGTENSHVDHFIRFLNTEQRHPGNRVVALAGGPTDRNAALSETGGIEIVVDEPSDLIGRVDAAIVSSRDGRHHRKQAEPLLAAGLPVLVDKPLAASVDDAQAILAAAALEAGKHVLLEKPIDVTVEAADQILDAERAVVRGHLPSFPRTGWSARR